MLREVLESGAELLEADIAAYAVRDGEVVVVKAFHDRDGFSGPDAAAAESIVAVLRDALPRSARCEIGDGVGQQSLADRAFVHGRALIVPLKRHRPDARRRPRLPARRARARSATTTGAWRPRWRLSSRSRCATCTPFSASTRSPRPSSTALLVEPPLLAGAEIGVKYQAAARAARVGGDFYDILSSGAGRVLIAVGDVCGRGLQAAVETALLRYTLRAYAQEGSPGEALSRLNSALLAQDAGAALRDDRGGRLPRRTPRATSSSRSPAIRGRSSWPVAGGSPSPRPAGFPVSMFPGETTRPTAACCPKTPPSSCTPTA